VKKMREKLKEGIAKWEEEIFAFACVFGSVSF
jgi:hypothetical protein